MSSELLSTLLVFSPPTGTSYPNIDVEPYYAPIYIPQIVVGTGNTGEASQGSTASISADSNTIIIGGPGDDTNNGAAWSFGKTNGVFVQNGNKILGTGVTGTAHQGAYVSVSADGNTFISSGTYDNSVGAVWVFTRPTPQDSWVQYGDKLVGTGYSGTSQQGTALAIVGNTIVFTNPQDNDTSGALWVFNLVTDTWTQTTKLLGTGNTGSAAIGLSISLSGDETTIAAGGTNDNSTVGAVWIWTLSGGIWSQQAKLIGTGNTGNSLQGFSVSLSADGNTLVSGGIEDNTYAGAIWVFKRSGSTWTQDGGKIIGTGYTGSAYMGYSSTLSSDANTLLFGAINDNSGVGASWIFVRTGGAWIQQGSKLVAVPSFAGQQGAASQFSSDGSFVSGGGYYAYYYNKTIPSTLRITSNLTVDGSINGNIELTGDTIISGTLTATNITTTTITANTYNTVSDCSLKTNIIPLSNTSLDMINSINCYQYNYLHAPGLHYGVLAQELEDTELSHLVLTGADGKKAVNYLEMIPLMISGVQELIALRAANTLHAAIDESL